VSHHDPHGRVLINAIELERLRTALSVALNHEHLGWLESEKWESECKRLEKELAEVNGEAHADRCAQSRRLKLELAEARRDAETLRAAIDDAEHAEDCQCLIRAKGGTKYDAAWCDCWLAKIYAIDAARKETP